MVSVTCDVCGAQASPNTEKKATSDWIQGWDLYTESPNAIQHSIRFLDRWDARRIAEFGAIHFCCVECKDKYVRKAA